MDPLETQEDVSCESLYLVAHLYDTQDLCRIAQDNIMAKLRANSLLLIILSFLLFLSHPQQSTSPSHF